jgi:toxin ParE1/3/4
MRLDIAVRARNDIDLIFIYGIENFGERQAKEYKDELLDLLNLILLQPKMGIAMQGYKSPIRTVLFHNHIVFYRLGRGTIKIMRILHGKQNWPDHI